MMSAVCRGRVSKPRRSHRAKSRTALRMMAIMTDGQGNQEVPVPKEFLETGRTGRRNAMPDILQSQNAEITTADLPERLQQLATSDPENPLPSTSRSEMTPNKPGEEQEKSS